MDSGNGHFELTRDKPEYYSSSLFSSLQYEDLKKAHVESVIPVTQEDYERMPKYKNVNEYKARRDVTDISPLSKQESERMLLQQGQNLEKDSAALAYKYAQQTEKSVRNNQAFFKDIKLIHL